MSKSISDKIMFFWIITGCLLTIIEITNATLIRKGNSEDVTSRLIHFDGESVDFYGGDCLFIRFKEKLMNHNDITVYGSGINGEIKIFDSKERLIETIKSIGSFGKYQGILNNLIEPEDEFILQFESDLSIEQIIDSLEISFSSEIHHKDFYYGSSVEPYVFCNGTEIEKMTISLYDSQNNEVGKKEIVLSYPSGGNEITLDEGHRMHYFTSTITSSFIVPSGFSNKVEYLVVGGGGGGGSQYFYNAGGGGGGGFLTNVISPSTGATTVVVGKGGQGSTSKAYPGSNGNDSKFGSIVAKGGGGGGSGYPAVSPSDGGSGGGGGAQTVTYTKSGASGITGQGFNGGKGKGHDSDEWKQSGGGGGGAGSAGFAGGETKGGNGGIGKQFYGYYYSGGGGGGRRMKPGSAGDGGIGGGGNGGCGGPGSDGRPNTGGGGGGAGSAGTVQKGGNGGSGIVIVRYNTQKITNLTDAYPKLQPDSYTIRIEIQTLRNTTYRELLMFNIINYSKNQNIHYPNKLFLVLMFFTQL